MPESVDRLVRNLAEVIEDLFSDNAAPRSRERRIQLIEVQVTRAWHLGLQAGKQRRGGNDYE
jgi:hypothetical protein